MSSLSAQTAIVTVTIMLLFLPAVIELRKPKDSGPRLISDNASRISIARFKIGITNIDEEEDNQSLIHDGSFLYRFPNLET